MQIHNDCWLKDECNHVDCESSFCMKRYKLNYLYNSALVSEEQRKHLELVLDIDGTDLEEFKFLKGIEQDILTFVKEGKQLYIHSSQAGNGKSSWSLRLLQAYLNKVWPSSALTCRALFVTTPKLLIALKDNISEKDEYASYIKENILKADLVVWDDIATKSTTTFEAENLFSMIDARISSGKANIYTSNLNRDELHRAMGDRLMSRICSGSYDVELRGRDKRGLKYDIEN